MANRFHAHLPLVFHVRGTVICRIWIHILIAMLYAAAVVCVHKYTEFKLAVDHNTLPVIGVVGGMLLVFRTNTAYDRYWEGRKLWERLTVNIRTLTRTFWIFVDDKNDTKLIIQKISAINLLIAFAYATKHYIREEYSYEEDDLIDLIGHLPHILTPSSNEPLFDQEAKAMDPQKTSGLPSKTGCCCCCNKDHDQENAIRQNRIRHPHQSSPYFKKFKNIPTNIPLEISYFISSFIKYCKDNTLIDSPTCRVLDTSVAQMIGCLTGFERIRRTPIPLAYSVHLQHVTWIVILLLPFQWLQTLNWFTIPAVGVAAFALFGILGIGREIENPFGYDYNDLNLDDFCQIIHKECLAIIAHKMPNPETWLFSVANRPIKTESTLTANALMHMKNVDLQGILSHGKDYKFSNRHNPDSNSHKTLQFSSDEADLRT